MFHKHPKTESKKLLDSKTVKGDASTKHLRTFAAMATGFATAMMAAVPAFADKNSDQVWYNFGNGLIGILDGIKPFTTALAIIALVVGGLGCIIGGEPSREKFKRALPWIAGGAAVVLLAVPLAERIIDAASNDGTYNGKYSGTLNKSEIQLNSFLATVGLPIVNI